MSSVVQLEVFNILEDMSSLSLLITSACSWVLIILQAWGLQRVNVVGVCADVGVPRVGVVLFFSSGSGVEVGVARWVQVRLGCGMLSLDHWAGWNYP